MSLASASACSSATPAAAPEAGIDAGVMDASFDADTLPATCAAGSKMSDGGTFVATGANVNVIVRVPPGYVPTTAYPFVMVYSPCCGDASELEQFTGLSPLAAQRGYIIAYADHIAGSPLAPIETAATIIPQVTSQYCVDPQRIYVTGHSDGASITEVIGVLSLVNVAAIAPSAAGFSITGAKEVGCRSAPLPVMEMHSSGDTVFPLSQGYGADVATWWAQCDGCDPTPSSPTPDGCVHYTSCTNGVEVAYCQGSAPHGNWPGLDTSIFDFFDRFTALQNP
jgi:polyhydroxybutyrate depolymerase